MVGIEVHATARPEFSFEPLRGAEAPARVYRDLVPRTLRLALAGGGTGGHMVPGLHLLSTLLAREAVADVVWFQTGRPVEQRVLAGAEELVAPASLERVTLALEPEGGGAPGLARLAWHTSPAAWRARAALRAHRSQVLVGLGGFTSLPAAIAARSLGLPIVLLEVNAHAGRATRWLSPFAARVAHAWRATVPSRDSRRDLHVGPVLSPSFTQGAPDERARREARRELGFDPDAPLLAVLGGSQGAGGINRFVAEFAPFWNVNGLCVLHQVGPGRLAEAGPSAPAYRAVEYVRDVPAVLRAATMILCRGGASTLAEVGAMRRPALVVPYPHHPDRHQERNALELGAGVRIVPEAELSQNTAREIVRLCGPSGAEDLGAMSRALGELVPYDGADRLFDEIVRLAAGEPAHVTSHDSVT